MNEEDMTKEKTEELLDELTIIILEQIKDEVGEGFCWTNLRINGVEFDGNSLVVDYDYLQPE